MIIRENKKFVTLCDLTPGEVFKYRDNFYMVVCPNDKAESGHIFCVDLETGWICQIKVSTLVENVDCVCNIWGFNNEK